MKKIYLIKKKLKDEQEKSLFRVSFTVPGSSIYQMNLVRATSTDEAKEKFITHNANKGRTVEIIAVKPAFDEDKKPGIPIIDKATSSDLTANKPAKEEISAEIKDAGISLDEQTATLSNIRADITGEYNTITLYKQHILSFENLYKQTKDEKYAQLVKIYNDIVEEEQLHVGQLNKAIEIMDPEETATVNKGIKEAKKNIQDENVEKTEKTIDDRLSPMTYKKLQEFGYGPDDWKDLTQEKANEIVKSHEQKSASGSEKSSSTQTNTTTKNNIIEPKNVDESDKLETFIKSQIASAEKPTYSTQEYNTARFMLGGNYNNTQKQLEKLAQNKQINSFRELQDGYVVDDYTNSGKVFQVVSYSGDNSAIISGKGVWDEQNKQGSINLDDPSNTITVLPNHLLGTYFAKEGMPAPKQIVEVSPEYAEEYNKFFAKNKDTSIKSEISDKNTIYAPIVDEATTAMNDMSISRADALEKCQNLGRKFIQHFDKVYKNPDSSSKHHWLSEMQAWYQNIKDIKLKGVDKPLLKQQLIDWFFTAQANASDYMINPTYAEDQAYEEFYLKLLNGQDIYNII
jgi:hypothetical protein